MHALQPLPFDPSKLRGLSERLVVSHHENNYGGAVKNLNRTEEELARVTITGMGLAGGSGWVVLAWDFQRGDARTYGSGHHTPACAFGQPLLVLDMCDHSYALDYGAAAAKYVDAFFQNIQWDEVNRRLESAQRRSP